jgi:type I restriction enzyme S subunit
MTRAVVPRSPLIEFAEPVRREIVIDPVSNYRTIGCHLYGEGVYERETKTGTEIKASRMFLIEKDDLVINRIWAQKGSAGIVPESLAGAVVTQDFPVWALNPDKAFPPYVSWYLKTPDFWEECRRHSHGTSGRERLSPRELPNVKFPLPPLDEQRRIVARVEELAALIEEAQALRVKAREEAVAFFSSVLATAYDEAVKIGGRVERLDDLCRQITDGTHSTPTYVSEGVPFLSIKDITTGTIRFDDVRFITPEEHARLIRRCKPERDDVLLTKVGTTGFAKAIDIDREFSIFVSLALLKLDKTRLDPKFTEYMLNSPRLREYSIAGTRGVGNQNLVLKFIREFPMPAPPLQEQRRIVAYLDDLQTQVDELTATQDATQAELDALLPSVLDQAFRGEL